MDIRVCVWQWCALWLATVISKSWLFMIGSVCVCVVPGLLVHMGGFGKLACVALVPATVLVCQIVLWFCACLYPMAVPFLHAGYDCSFVGLRSFLSTLLLDVQKQDSLFLWVCTVLFHSLCCSWNWWIIFLFCSSKTVLNCICGAKIVLIKRQAQSSESKNIIGTQQSILINVFATLSLEY